ncbi:unnamed protein product [Parnassius mnemosyne]|uniref:Uncharacterized protein n=1 Tax=Parnassius mnemosyne TaxID=213953 RepID=A0AAV1L7D9_9NEOP
MPKRRKEDIERDLQRYYRKIRKLEEKQRSRCPTTPSEYDNFVETQGPNTTEVAETKEQHMPCNVDKEAEVLDPEVLLILVDPVVKKQTFGPDISDNLASRWTPILRKGLNKEDKESITKLYQIPANCDLLLAPTLNPEIGTAITEMAKNRDKKIEFFQQQLGIGLTALGRAMSLVLKDKGEKMQIIKNLNDAARILTDLHFNETQTRKKLITPTLDKSFLNVIKDVDHDEFLYGRNLSEKIKAVKIIEKSSQSIKKADYNMNKNVYSQTSQHKSNKQGNFSGPPRTQQRFAPATRSTARGRYKKPMLPIRRTGATALPLQSKDVKSRVQK